MGAIPNIINKHDKGFTTEGNWFGANENFHKLENITIEHAERVLDYPVTKEPLFFQAPTNELLKPFQQVAKAHCLYRHDIGEVLYPTVGDDYTVAPNSQLLKQVEAMLVQGRELGNDVSIDSVVTLGNGQSSIINLKIDELHIEGDQSKTVTKMIMSNAFGGNALQSCLYNLRMLCANMSKMVFNQGKKNGTYKKVRHTKNVNSIFDNAIMNLQDVIFNAKAYNQKLSELNKELVNPEYVENFLETMFPTKDKAEGRGLTLNTNKQESILNNFEGKDDLKHLPFSRYRLLNAVTDYTSHDMSLNGTKDDNGNRIEPCQGKRFINQISGSGEKLNQQAFQLLTAV